MILSKSTIPTSNRYISSCYRYAKNNDLTILDDVFRFTIKEAMSEDYWFEKEGFNDDNLHDFVSFCESYKNEVKGIAVNYFIKIECPNCNRCMMTPEQIETNSIITGNNKHFIVCPNCCDILELDRKLEI